MCPPFFFLHIDEWLDISVDPTDDAQEEPGASV